MIWFGHRYPDSPIKGLEEEEFDYTKKADVHKKIKECIEKCLFEMVQPIMREDQLGEYHLIIKGGYDEHEAGITIPELHCRNREALIRMKDGAHWKLGEYTEVPDVGKVALIVD